MNYKEYFETKKRSDGSFFVSLKDEAPEELIKFVHNVHLELYSAPNDWIYEKITDAFESEEPDLREAFIEPDIYINQLTEWSRNSFAIDFINESLENMSRDTDYIKLLQWAQYEAIRRIYDMVADFLDEHKEEGN